MRKQNNTKRSLKLLTSYKYGKKKKKKKKKEWGDWRSSLFNPLKENNNNNNKIGGFHTPPTPSSLETTKTKEKVMSFKLPTLQVATTSKKREKKRMMNFNLLVSCKQKH